MSSMGQRSIVLLTMHVRMSPEMLMAQIKSSGGAELTIRDRYILTHCTNAVHQFRLAVSKHQVIHCQQVISFGYRKS